MGKVTNLLLKNFENRPTFAKVMACFLAHTVLYHDLLLRYITKGTIKRKRQRDKPTSRQKTSAGLDVEQSYW